MGFTPRCARESEGDPDTRIDRIARCLRESKYSIHDLSRFQGEGPERLSRFNMPLELGMAVALRYERQGSGTPHRWVALVPADFVHQRFISDLAGFDPPAHEQTPATVIRAIAGWLTIQPDYSLPAPSPRTILAAFPELVQQLDQAAAERLGFLPWTAILERVELVIARMGAPLA